jgi:hypothetical protein
LPEPHSPEVPPILSLLPLLKESLLQSLINLLVGRRQRTHRAKSLIIPLHVLLVRPPARSNEVLVLLDTCSNQLLEPLHGVDELGCVIDDALLAAIAVSTRRSSGLLLKVNQDVDRAIELGRDVIAVVVALVLATVPTLGTGVVAHTKRGGLDLVALLDVRRELLDAVEAVQDAARRARSDGGGHVEQLLSNGSVPKNTLAPVQHANSRVNSRNVVLLDVQRVQGALARTLEVGKRTAGLHDRGRW